MVKLPNVFKGPRGSRIVACLRMTCEFCLVRAITSIVLRQEEVFDDWIRVNDVAAWTCARVVRWAYSQSTGSRSRVYVYINKDAYDEVD